MNLDDISVLLEAARDQIAHGEYVIMGSLSVIGITHGVMPIPARMLMSNDLDCYPMNDPGRAFDLTKTLGQGSPFDKNHGFYFDPLSPRLPTLPKGWQERLIRLTLANGITLHCLEPNDAAISKYARGEPRDCEWIRAGLRASILSLATIKHRLGSTTFLDDKEMNDAHQKVRTDEAWMGTLRQVTSRHSKPK